MILSDKKLREMKQSDEPEAIDLAQALVNSQKKLVSSSINSIVGGKIDKLREDNEAIAAELAQKIEETKVKVEQSCCKDEIQTAVNSLSGQIANSNKQLSMEIVKANELINKVIEIESEVEPEEPRHEWTFTVQRDANGLIASVDAKQRI